MTLMDNPANAEELEALRAAGHTITNDDAFVRAFAEHYGTTLESARLTLAGTEDVITRG